MQLKNQIYKVKGMRKDESYSAFNPEFSWDNRNIRLTARDGNDMISVTNEKGNKKLLLGTQYYYSVDFLKYLQEQEIADIAYTYGLTTLNYLQEQSDYPVNYTNDVIFENYLQEQQDFEVTYTTSLSFLNYLQEQSIIQ